MSDRRTSGSLAPGTRRIGRDDDSDSIRRNLPRRRGRRVGFVPSRRCGTFKSPQSRISNWCRCRKARVTSDSFLLPMDPTRWSGRSRERMRG